MSNQSKNIIACPKCSNPLRRIKRLTSAMYECRQCHSFWLDRKQPDPLRSQDISPGAEHVMAELTSKNNPDRRLNQVPVAWVISAFLKYALSIVATLIGFVFVILSFTDGSILKFEPFTFLMATSLIAFGIHSYSAGKALRHVTLVSVPRLYRFLDAAALYGIAASLGFAFGLGSENDLTTKLGMALYVLVMFFFIPILVMSLYFRYSKKVKELYLTWDAAESTQSQSGR